MDQLGIGFLQAGRDGTLGGGLERGAPCRPHAGALTVAQLELLRAISFPSFAPFSESSPPLPTADIFLLFFLSPVVK